MTRTCSLFATGECKAGAPDLADYVARSMEESKLRMGQYVRDWMTGAVPSGMDIATDQADIKVDEEEDFSDRLNKVSIFTPNLRAEHVLTPMSYRSLSSSR